MGLFDKKAKNEALNQVKDTAKGIGKQIGNATSSFGFGKPKDEKMQSKIEALNNEILTRKAEIAELVKEKAEKIENLNAKLDSIENEYKLSSNIVEKQQLLYALHKQITEANGIIEFQELGFFEKQYKFSDSEHYKRSLDEIRALEKDMVKNATAVVITQEMTLNNSKAQGRTLQNQLIKAALRGFNGEADSFLTKISASNVDAKLKALKKSFEQLNNMYSRNAIRISYDYLHLKEKELKLVAEYELKKQEEKDILREQREREREDKKLQAELKKQQAKYDKDITQFTNAIDIAEDKIKNASESEIDELRKQIDEYKRKIEALNNDKEELDTKFSNAKAGYVYVISNVGSFGEGIVKIGVTRRLTPTDRVDELGSASVPFKFSINALIFNDNAFDLESRLHQHFDSKRVNKANNRKEYFKVSLNEIKEFLDNDKSLNVEWNEKPENFEYEQTVLMDLSENKESKNGTVLKEI